MATIPLAAAWSVCRLVAAGPAAVAIPAIWPPDGGIRREVIAAGVGVALLVALLPRGRRRMALVPLALILLAPLPSAVALLFPESQGSAATAAGLARFALLSSLFLSVVVLALVVAWERVARPLPRIFLDVVRSLAVAVALIVILSESGVDPQSLFTGSALFTAALGFALKDTLGNVFAGLAIHAEHPFAVGDWIQYDTNQAHIGRVVEINWRATKVLTLDEAYVIIPNGQLAQASIRNFTKPDPWSRRSLYVIIPNGQLAQASIRNFTKPDPWSRRSLYVITPYDVSPQRVQRIILEAIRGSFGVRDEPPPSVVTNDFKDRGVEHWVRFFTTEFDKRDRVDGMARDRIWFALARHGIEIPVATQAIRLQQLPPPPAAEPWEAAVERRVALLGGIPLLADLDDGQRRRLAAENRELVFAAGEPVVREGDVGDSMFVVVDGEVDVRAAGGARGTVSLARLGPGQVFGELSLLTGAPRSATVAATVETRVLEISKASIAHLLEAERGLVDKLGAALAARLADRSRLLTGEAVAPATEPDMFRRIRDFFAT